MSERWLPVVGYEGYYEVSDMGRVKSLERILTRSNGVRFVVRSRFIASHVNRRTGYTCVTLAKAGKSLTRPVHRLVAQAFIPNEDDRLEVCHRNGIKTDPRANNLYWGTHSQNMYDRRSHGADHNVNKDHCPRGHSLIGFNVYSYRPGQRQCRACARARSAGLRAQDAGFQAESDRHYSRIMEPLS